MRKIKTRKEQLLPQENGNEILSLCNEAITKSLKKRGMYSVDVCQELSAQLVLNIFNVLHTEPINKLMNYIRTASKNLVINFGMRTRSNQELATDPFDMPTLEMNDGFTTLDAIIGEEYNDVNKYHLGIIRESIGAKDYLMLESHFRDGESYKTIAEKMGLEVHIVANHIARARAKCQALKQNGRILY